MKIKENVFFFSCFMLLAVPQGNSWTFWESSSTKLNTTEDLNEWKENFDNRRETLKICEKFNPVLIDSVKWCLLKLLMLVHNNHCGKISDKRWKKFIFVVQWLYKNALVFSKIIEICRKMHFSHVFKRLIFSVIVILLQVWRTLLKDCY